ncbi:MAG: hypothetical protein GY722_00400 [bacterium]|nr:hypothetical protein [bacterium]
MALERVRIELAEPHRRLPLDQEQQLSAVDHRVQPLAVARSLTECKREAELLAAKRRRRDVQRRQVVLAVLAFAVTPFLLGSPSNVSAVLLVAVLVVATRSVTILLGTLTPQALGEQHEVFYQ